MVPWRVNPPYRRSAKDGQTSFGPRNTKTIQHSSLRGNEATSQDERVEATRLAHTIDEAMGFARYESGKRKIGWLCNMRSTSIEDEHVPGGRAAIDFYFIAEDGGTFKATICYEPYFLIAVRRNKEAEVEEWCRRSFEGLLKKVQRIQKEDLQMPNHLLGYRRSFLKLRFANVQDLLSVRRVLTPIAETNKKKMSAMDTYAEVASANAGFDIFTDEEEYEKRTNVVLDASDFISDIREYDVPYHVRVAIDKDIRIGKWYTVEAKHGQTTLKCIDERLQRADPVVLAFDIETTKLPLKFPDAALDRIMMISYMIDGQGFLITNREIVSEDIADFEYTPKPEYHGPFVIFNEQDEKAVLDRFFQHIKDVRPTVIATYNGDFFDWPFIEARASVLGIDMYQEIGFRKNSEDIYGSDYCAHMDAFAWVNRDSYLPQGSRGLKAVTVAKLGYDPDELDPELMTPYANERPQTLAEYSVSDAVATYYLYMKYVHPFIFSLCTIIPLGPDDVLRKGTGTLCEMLLMVQAYQKNIVLPNKHQTPKEAFWEGHLLESETYVGGHVESIEAGVFRSDIPCDFTIDTKAIDELLGDLDAALKFSITVEEKKSTTDIANYDEVRAQIEKQLLQLRNTPTRSENPAIYHLDVASMYPNIMTTNRLQPDSMIQESHCAACDFNRPGKTCDRRLPWSWRGEFLPPKKDEYNMIRHALENEKFPGRNPKAPTRTFHDLSADEQASLVKKRLQDYSKKIYHKIHDTRTVEREAIICQRENPFYVDTVKDFRDRRYEFKGKQKLWKSKADALKASAGSTAELEQAKKMIVLFDSLQLAHKVILNSFYGYVMRKGSRWYSMEMAGVTCLTGARIIQMARRLVERVGRPLELDTDGIWCILPATFPDNVTFELKNGKKLAISYPCVMLNHLVHAKFTNHQYQELVDPKTFRYETHSDNSIFFEVDGPYRAMILPTSKEEDKNLKKRYAVFNHDGTLAELKGFEVKRRGELKLIKTFQSHIFKFFLEGSTLSEIYGSLARVANKWLDVLYQRGAGMVDEELIDLICENKSMAKTLEEYGTQKSTAITTAKRLAEFLGEQMIKDKGLNCKYIISSRPRNAPVTERAIPVAIFAADEQIKRYFLRKWMRDDPGDMDPRTVIDWEYYMERLGSVIQKLITIPAALQKIPNPVPRVAHPEWLERRIKSKDDVLKQKKMTEMFSQRSKLAEIHHNILSKPMVEVEDLCSSQPIKMKSGAVGKMRQKRKAPEPALSVQVDPYARLPVQVPSIVEDYQGWLRYQKKKWKIQKQARVRRRQLFGERHTDANDTIGTFFRNQAELLFISTWQVLQLAETENPGEVKAFVLIDRKIHAIKVVVPRQIFINLRSQDVPDVDIAGCTVEKVNHILPNGRSSVHLFKLTMAEQIYQNESKKLYALFAHPSVEGVYETQISPQVRALLDLGSLCTFDESQKGVLGKGLEQGFDLSALRHTTSQQPYLFASPLAYLYIYHVVAGDRQIFALFLTSIELAYVVVLSKSNGDMDFPNTDKIYRELLAQKLADSDGRTRPECFEYKANTRFKITRVTTKRRAHLEVGDLVKRMRKDENRPIMLVLQSPKKRGLPHDIPILKELPTLSLQFDETDRQMPPLGWQLFVMKRLLTRYLSLGSLISHITELARYGDVPICSVDTPDPSFLIDVAYARRLRKERVVLWWSKSPRPDHAGYEKDDILRALEKVETSCVNQAGAYSSVCIEVDIRNMAVNTIISSSIINEAEGSDPVFANPAAEEVDPSRNDSDTMQSDDAFAAVGLKILRDMVKAWWAAACSSDGDVMADIMVQHLVRWIANPSSFLYDPRLHYYIQVMSRKALQQLMSDFRRVGSNIVFANQNRLFLQTSKTEVGNAYAYSQYIVKTIKGKPLFAFLDMDIREYWDYLVWYDEYNYGGKACQEVMEADTQQLNTVMHWQLATFLPAHLQSTFHDWIVEFIQLMHSRKRPLCRPSTQTRLSEPRPTQLPVRELALEAEDVTLVGEVLSKALSNPLKKHISSLLRRQRAEMLHPDLASDYAFPQLPGSHLALSDPVLQLTKSLMQVFSLEKSISLEARLLRKELLSLFDLREFGEEGKFINPSQTCKIEGLICQECCFIRDVDLCRDEEFLLTHPSTKLDSGAAAANSPQQSLPRCASCNHPYSRLRIEELLLASLQRLVLAWTTQDLKCNKCGRLRSNEFMEHCGCAGVWVETVKRQDVRQGVGVHAKIATSYQFRMLEALVEEMEAGLGA